LSTSVEAKNKGGKKKAKLLYSPDKQINTLPWGKYPIISSSVSFLSFGELPKGELPKVSIIYA
jgi:hypothetical protein